MVYLSNEEQMMLNGEYGEGKQKAMEILVTLAKIYKAEKLIDVSSVQISGVSYKTMGDAGLEFVKFFSELGTKVKVNTFINPAGMDAQRWKQMGIPETFAKKQIELMQAYESMGINPTYTCTPYHIGIRPNVGEHVAWAESNAVSFANSVLGARTNREGGPSALASAITGKTAYYGLHIAENRKAKIVIDVKAPVNSRFEYGNLGAYVGKLVKGKYPAFTGLETANEIKMKYLGAAMAASGSVPFFMVKGKTPEWNITDDVEYITVEKKELDEIVSAMNQTKDVEIITLGCPHASLEEINEIAEMLRQKKLEKKVYIFTSRAVRKMAEEKGLIKIIEDAGGRVYADTCMVVMPLEEMGYKKTGVDSGKAAKYLPSFNKQKIRYADVKDLIKGDDNGN